MIAVSKESERAKPPPKRFTIEGVALGANKGGEVVTAAFANIGASSDIPHRAHES